MPVLIICGAALGYMRIMSGGMFLPMLMHGCHNAAVLMLEGKV
jgi:membrane protease YdiL (CAAX protease family)